MIEYYNHPMSNPRGGWDKGFLKRDGKILYAHMSLLPLALATIREQPKIRTLVTEGGDLCLHEVGDNIVVGNTNLSSVSCSVKKSDIPNIDWFSSNNNTNLRIHTFPLGLFKKPLDYHEGYFDKFRLKQRKTAALVNCDIQNNVAVRAPLIKALSAKEFVHITSYAGMTSDNVLKTIWAEIADYKYIICPASNGLDTCRIWEALYMGTIPVVETKYPYYATIASALPIIGISSLADVTLEYLENEYNSLQHNIDSLYKEYWLEWLAQ